MGKKREAVRLPIQRIKPSVLTGLNDKQVKERIEKNYVNISNDPNSKSVAQIVFDNVFTFFNTILFLIALTFLGFIIYLSVIGRQDVINEHFGFSKFGFLIPAVMNVVTGSIQQIKSKKVLDKLKIVTSLNTGVIRNGQLEKIKAEGVVVDDIAVLNAGEQAVADMIILSGHLQVDESMLTGESDYVKKEEGDIVYSGSSIIVGSARAYVDKVGDDTYVSSLQKKVKSLSNHKSELMTNIMKIVKVLSVVLLIVSAVIVATLCFKVSKWGSNADLWGMTMSLSNPITWARIMITVGSFAVGIIPSGLVLTTSVALVISVVSLARQNTIVQNLYSLENLSRVDVICLDKTGTLTDGSMKLIDVKSYVHLEDVYEHIRNLMGAMDTMNQTAQAIYERFGKNENVEIEKFLPFSSEKKSSGLVYKNGDVLTMGAPEYLLGKDDERLGFVYEKAKEGRRVIALKLNNELLCFFVIEDQIRLSAPDTLKFFKENGVKVKIISGDNLLTVTKIAKECGVENAELGISLENVPLDEIKNVASKYTIFSRVSPEQKAELVSALQSENHKVAMTGDGVNDVLALRKADSSITFAKATDAAKSCADVLLLDNDFSHLKEVVGQGRRVINNIQRSSVLFLMKSFAIIILAFALIPMRIGQMWYTVENAYMLEAAIIGTGAFLLSMEGSKKPLRGTFFENIIPKVLASGVLIAGAVYVPILIYRLPSWFDNLPTLISMNNVKTMMTLLLLSAGFIVLLSMSWPINKWRGFVIGAVALTASALSFMLPTTYIGGRTTGAAMFAYDSSLGQTFFDSQFMQEFLKPWNCPAVKELFSTNIHFNIMGTFVLIVLPVYMIIMFSINKRLDKKYGVLK